ncbi:MAG: galactose oxidase-like domain-containing protein, partial [Thermoanaerobaculia bacterium]
LFAAALLALAAAPGIACPWHERWKFLDPWSPRPPSWTPEALAARRAAPAQTPIARAVDGGPSEVGQWQPPQDWPVIAIHAALLPNGRVLQYSYPFGGPGSNAKTWDPLTGEFEDAPVDTDLFCSGLTLLPDGRVFVTGGNDYACTFQGRQDTHVFDFREGTWTKLGDMSVGRWYPSNVALADGSMLIVSGLDRECTTTPVMERYSPRSGLEVKPGGERFTALFPRLHLLTSGEVAHVGPEPDTFIYDPVGDEWRYADSTLDGDRYDGSSFRMPGAPDTVVACGGNRYDPPGIEAKATCEKIDLSFPEPAWQATGTMHYGRAHLNPLILPDGSVLAVGGGLAQTDDLYGEPVLNAERYDPATETWTLLPAQQCGRMYHSTVVLLPDGRVLSAGQDLETPPPCNGGYAAEIYEPPYLFRGPRPSITSAPSEVAYGETFLIATAQAAGIASVALIAPTTVTHSVNTGQRFVSLPFAVSGPGELQVTAPAGGAEAPPGFYMLFVVDGDGVPSVANWLGLASEVFADGFETGSTVAWDSAVP